MRVRIAVRDFQFQDILIRSVPEIVHLHIQIDGVVNLVIQLFAIFGNQGEVVKLIELIQQGRLG